MATGSARFLLEFQATGDQEVVASLKAISSEGKTTASDLGELDTALRELEGSTEGYASGIKDAVGPTQELTSATSELTPTMEEMTGQADATATGLETMIEAEDTAQESTMGLGDAMGTITGSITAIGGSIGSLVGTMFRYQSAQDRVVKANIAVSNATEANRKANVALDTVLSKATTNTQAIAAARQELTAAQDELNRLMDAGVSSGSQYEAAQARVAQAQEALRQAAAGTGVDMKKLNDTMGATQKTAGRMVTATNQQEKANKTLQQTLLDGVFNFASLAGSITQTITSFNKWGPAVKGIKAGLLDLISFAGRGGLSLKGIGTAITATVLPAMGALILAAAAGLAAYEGFRAVPKVFSFINAAIEGNTKVMIDSQLQMLELLKNVQRLSPTGTAVVPLIDEMIKKIKELAKTRKINIDTTEQEKSAQSGLSQILSKLPQQYKDMINEALGMEFIPPTTESAATSMNNLSNAAEAVVTPIKNVAMAWSDATGKIDAFNLRQGEQTMSIKEANATVDEAQKHIENLIGVTETAPGVFEQSGASFVRAWSEVATVSGSVKRAVENGSLAFNDLVNHAHAAGEAVRIYSTEADNATELTEEETGALTAMQGSLQDSIDAHYENASALSRESTQLLMLEDAQGTIHEAYMQSAADLNVAIALREDEAAQAELLATAINEERQAVIEEAQALEARAAIAADNVIQQQELANAYNEGVVSIAEWSNELATAEANEQGQIDALAEMGATFQRLPSFMEPTIENLKLMADAARNGSDALVAYGDAVREAFSTATEQARSGLEGLMDLFDKEEANEKFDDWWEGLPESVRANLGEGRKEGIMEMGKFFTEMRGLSESFDWMVLFEGFEDARQWYAGRLRSWAGENEGTWKDIFNTAADIAETGSDDIITKMEQILSSGLPPETILGQLKDIKTAEEGRRMGAELMAAYKAAIKSNAPGAEAFAFSGAANQAALDKNMPSLKPLAPVRIDADISPAVQKIQQLENIIVSTAASPIVIPADLSQAIQAVTQFENTLVTTAASPIMITADLSQAIQAVTQFENTLLSTPIMITVTVNASVATTAFNAVSTAALNARNNVNVASSGIKSALTAAGSAASSFASRASSSFNTAGKAALTARNNVNAMSSGMKSALNSASSAASSFASRFSSAMNSVKSQANSARSAVNSLKSAISGLRGKSITIHVGISGPGLRYLQHGYHGVVDKPMLFIAGEAGPERVDVTPGRGAGHGASNEIINRTVHVGTSGGGGGGNRPINITVVGELNGKELIRFTRRGIMEEASGAM